jgi:hypothetical protein
LKPGEREVATETRSPNPKVGTLGWGGSRKQIS